MLRVSLTTENVDIVEGDNGVFCAFIEDPNVVLERNVSVTLNTMEGTAEGDLYTGIFALSSCIN